MNAVGVNHSLRALASNIVIFGHSLAERCAKVFSFIVMNHVQHVPFACLSDLVLVDPLKVCKIIGFSR